MIKRHIALLFLLPSLACSGASSLAPRGAPRPASSSFSASGAADSGDRATVAGAESLAREEAAAPAERPGLGTRFGEDRPSAVHDVAFERHGGPIFVGTLYYNDRDGVAALRARSGRLLPCRTGEPFLRGPGGFFAGVIVEVIDEAGRSLPSYRAADRVLVEGEAGGRYALRLTNNTGDRFEVVASVDGLDVVDGGAASPDKRGYVVPPFGHLAIEGFRRSMNEVAAFRFGSVRDSYAARTAETGDRNVGVIGLALFSERGLDWRALDREAERREQADPFPGRFAQPPLN